MSFDNVVNIAGALVPLFSALASFVNHIIRVQSNNGAAANPALLAVGSVLNLGAINIDKGVQLAKMAAGIVALQTQVQPVAQAPAADEVPKG